MIGSSSEEQCKKILEKYHFETVRKLGKGSYGHVFLTSKFVNAANFYAVKCINLRKAIKDPKLKIYVQQETQTMSSLNHPNIVRLENAFSDSGWHFFVMEYCDMSTLHGYQSKITNKVFSLTEAIRIFKQIINGLKAIHANNIIHRDIKCDNIFLSKKKGGSFVCKIGDFGFAKVIQNTTAKTNCGTTLYMAPQVLFNRPYDQKVDVWSVSVVFYYLIFGEYPFKTLNIEKEIQDKCSKSYSLKENHQNLQTKFKKEQIANLQNFFEKAFVINPDSRINLQEIEDHPLFNLPQKQLSVESTSDDQAENEAEWEKNQILYIQEVMKDISRQKIFQPYLKEAAKFYLNKVIKMFLKDNSVVKYMKQQPNRKLTTQLSKISKQVDLELCESMNYLEKYPAQLKKIDKFYEGFHLYHEEFHAFKQGYRNTIGRIFEEIHSKLPDSQKKSILKFKIFTCHVINRVFKNGAKKDVFPFYQSWLKQNGKKSSVKQLNFEHFSEWINSESSQKLLQSIEVLNKTFYKKQ